MKNLKLTIGWLYPDLMSTYGDRGNILVFQYRCARRGISCTVVPIHHETSMKDMETIDLIFGGGSQDREQEIVMRDVKGKKQAILKQLIEDSIPALFVCGSPQLMGKWYEPAVGQRIEGLGIFDIETINPGPDTPRCIGNIVATVQGISFQQSVRNDNLIVGFENHGGRTRLGPKVKPLAHVVKGYGNNGEDGTEGVVYKNAIGCYFHGPFLPKNPHMADFLIQRALEVKYKEEVALAPLDDTLEWQAHTAILKKLGIEH